MKLLHTISLRLLALTTVVLAFWSLFFYFEMMNEINEKYGMDIQVRGVFSDAEMSQLRPRQRYLCVIHLDDGQIAFQVVAKN